MSLLKAKYRKANIVETHANLRYLCAYNILILMVNFLTTKKLTAVTQDRRKITTILSQK